MVGGSGWRRATAAVFDGECFIVVVQDTVWEGSSMGEDCAEMEGKVSDTVVVEGAKAAR